MGAEEGGEVERTERTGWEEEGWMCKAGGERLSEDSCARRPFHATGEAFFSLTVKTPCLRLHLGFLALSICPASVPVRTMTPSLVVIRMECAPLFLSTVTEARRSLSLYEGATLTVKESLEELCSKEETVSFFWKDIFHSQFSIKRNK